MKHQIHNTGKLVIKYKITENKQLQNQNVHIKLTNLIQFINLHKDQEQKKVEKVNKVRKTQLVIFLNHMMKDLINLLQT